jgi:hypothetical protein
MRLSFHSDGWNWGAAEREWSILRGRMSTVARGFAAALADVELSDGWVQLELAVGAERSFHGLVWRAADDRNYESFYVRPHQVGNPDSIQYTPVTNGVSSWQLYHGKGFGRRSRSRSATGSGSASTSSAGEPRCGSAISRTSPSSAR